MHAQRNRKTRFGSYSAAALIAFACVAVSAGHAEQPPSPCHPNPLAAHDRAIVANRGDVVHLPSR